MSERRVTRRDGTEANTARWVTAHRICAVVDLPRPRA